jgi:undecaprenyl-diphosphatase
MSLLEDMGNVDLAVYNAIARTPTPRLDAAMRELSRAADYSRLSVAAAAAIALVGGPQGRRAAAGGLASLAVTSTVVNLAIKPLGRRRRPDRVAGEVPHVRHVRMPRSTSFPSGHTAAAVAFASGAARFMPATTVPLNVLATAVGYSRVHTGVHYPGDVLVGALIGAVTADVVTHRLARRMR